MVPAARLLAAPTALGDADIAWVDGSDGTQPTAESRLPPRPGRGAARARRALQPPERRQRTGGHLARRAGVRHRAAAFRTGSLLRRGSVPARAVRRGGGARG